MFHHSSNTGTHPHPLPYTHACQAVRHFLAPQVGPWKMTGNADCGRKWQYSLFGLNIILGPPAVCWVSYFFNSHSLSFCSSSPLSVPTFPPSFPRQLSPWRKVLKDKWRLLRWKLFCKTTVGEKSLSRQWFTLNGTPLSFLWVFPGVSQDSQNLFSLFCIYTVYTWANECIYVSACTHVHKHIYGAHIW